MKTNPKYHHVIILYLLTMIFLFAFGYMATAQLIVEGQAKSGTLQGRAYVTNYNGEQVPVEFKGKKKKYKLVFDSRNVSYRIDFKAGNTTRTIHIFTHQPDGEYHKWFELVNIDLSEPVRYRETVIYWSPSEWGYVHRHDITNEDAIRLADMDLWPTRIYLKDGNNTNQARQ